MTKAALLISLNVVCAVVAYGFNGSTPCQSSSNQVKAEGGGTIEGKVFQLIDGQQKPYFGFLIQAVQVDSGDVEAHDITDEKGHFSLKVRAGKYRIEPRESEHESEYLRIAGNSEADTLDVSVKDSECVRRMLHITNNSFISGVVLDEDGKKIKTPSYSLRLITVGKNEGDPGFESFGIDRLSHDEFRFERIPPGEYHLSFNYRARPDEDMPYPTCFYPGTVDRAKATVIRVEEGTALSPLVFKLPPKLHKVSLNGLVVWKDGRPAAGVELQVIDVEAASKTDFSKDRLAFSKHLNTDENGYFAWEDFAERKYKIVVIAWEKRSDGNDHEIGEAETEEFALGTNNPSFRIELREVDPNRAITRLCN